MWYLTFETEKITQPRIFSTVLSWRAHVQGTFLGSSTLVPLTAKGSASEAATAGIKVLTRLFTSTSSSTTSKIFLILTSKSLAQQLLRQIFELIYNILIVPRFLWSVKVRGFWVWFRFKCGVELCFHLILNVIRDNSEEKHSDNSRIRFDNKPSTSSNWIYYHAKRLINLVGNFFFFIIFFLQKKYLQSACDYLVLIPTQDEWLSSYDHIKHGQMRTKLHVAYLWSAHLTMWF